MKMYVVNISWDKNPAVKRERRAKKAASKDEKKQRKWKDQSNFVLFLLLSLRVFNCLAFGTFLVVALSSGLCGLSGS